MIAVLTTVERPSTPAERDEERARKRAEVRALVEQGLPSAKIRERLGVDWRLVADVREEAGKMEGRYQATRDRIRELVRQGVDDDAICAREKCGKHLVVRIRHALGLARPSKTEARQKRVEHYRAMADRGYSTRQIAAELGMSNDSARKLAKSHGIAVHADRVVGRTAKLNADRIVAAMAIDAEILTADVDLIAYAELDRAQVALWHLSFSKSRDRLNRFIRRLAKELPHEQSEPQTPAHALEDSASADPANADTSGARDATGIPEGSR